MVANCRGGRMRWHEEGGPRIKPGVTAGRGGIPFVVPDLIRYPPAFQAADVRYGWKADVPCMLVEPLEGTARGYFGALQVRVLA